MRNDLGDQYDIGNSPLTTPRFTKLQYLFLKYRSASAGKMSRLRVYHTRIATWLDILWIRCGLRVLTLRGLAVLKFTE